MSILIFIFILIFENLFAITFNKEIIPFKGTKYSLVKFERLDVKVDKIVGIGYYFDDKGEAVKGSSFLAIFQLNDDVEYEILWRYNFPAELVGDFTDFCIQNIDADDLQEIIVTSQVEDPTNSISPLFIFKQDNEELVYLQSLDFTQLLSLKKIPMILPCKSGPILLHEDEMTEVVQVLIDHDKVHLDTLWMQHHPEKYFQSKLITMSNSGGKKILIRANHDLLFFTNLLSIGNNKEEEIFFEPNGNVWDLENIVSGDFNGDKKGEMIIGLKNGGANMISSINDSIIITEIFNSSLQFDKLFVFDLDNDGKDNLILSDKNGEVIKHFYYDKKDDSFWNSGIVTNTDLHGIKILHGIFEENSELNFSYLYPDFAHHGILKITIGQNISPVVQPVFVREKIADDYNFREIDNLITLFTNIDGKSEKIVTQTTNDPIIKDLGSLNFLPADNIISLGEEFIEKVDLYSVSSEELNYMINAPEGFRFNLVERSFEWKPNFNQLGFYTINAKFYWDDVEVTKAFSIYVNDKIEIINKLSERNIIQAGETFQYQLNIRDQNREDYKKITMVKYPDGANIDKNGTITWRSYESQKDWNDFEVIVSDGYSSDKMEFSIFVNHPLAILECPEKVSILGKQFTYDIKIKDRNQGFFLNQYKKPPRIEDWATTGIYETLILTAQTKIELVQIVENFTKNNTFINGDGFKIIEAIFENNRLILIFTYKNEILPVFSEVISTFFNFINYEIPNHTSFTSPQYHKYNLRQGPENLFITKNGVIKWKPDESNLGVNMVSFTANDGYYSDEYTLKIFVNDLPKVISNPPKFVNLNEKFTYQLIVEDKNPEDQIEYYLIESPEGVNISKDGELSWDVNNDNSKDENYFEIGITDTRDTTFQKFTLRINQKPVVKLPKQIISKINRLVNYKIEAHDPESGVLTYKILEAPKGVQLDNGVISWKPGSNNLGSNNIIIEIEDAEGNALTANFDLFIVKNKFNFKILGIIAGSAAVTSLIFILF